MPLPSCRSRRAWWAEFDEDPTTSDADGDSVKDRTSVRTGPSVSIPVADGQWRPTSNVVIDTRPFDPFDRRTILAVRFQNLTVEPAQWGALVWLNVDNAGPEMLAVYLSLRHDAAGGQTLHLQSRSTPGSDDLYLASFAGLPDRLVDAVMDVDPIARAVDLWIDGDHKGRWPVPSPGAPVGDDFASVANTGGSSVFDFVRVTICE